MIGKEKGLAASHIVKKLTRRFSNMYLRRIVYFRTVIGQSKQKEQFAALADRVPHAFMVSGPEGSGSLAFGLAVAQWIFCSGDKNTDSCGICRNCRRMERLEHPDFHVTMPVVNPKSDHKDLSAFAEPWRKAVLENPYLDLDQWLAITNKDGKLPNISAEAIRDIQQGLQLVSYEGGAKVHLVWLAEYMGKEGNRLLKLIEEPPKDTYLILVTQNPGRILPTILSRCQLISLVPIKQEEIETLLEDRGVEPEAERIRIARWANGNLGKALFLTSEEGMHMSKLWLDWLRLSFQPKQDKMVRWVNQTANTGRTSLKILFNFGNHYLREVMYMKIRPAEIEDLQDDLGKSAQKMAGFLTMDSIDKLKTLLETYSYYVERNANGKILLMDLSLRIGKILTSDFLLNKQK